MESLSEIISEQVCNGCEKSVTQIKKRYKGKKYCLTCYSRIFKRCVCPNCGVFARLPKNDTQAMCNECIKKQPCIRCNLTNKPVGKITEYGFVCNSCSVYFRQIGLCERCKTPSQKLTKISRFNDGLRVCQKCSTRDYETCPSCSKYRLLELDKNGKKVCKKCKTSPDKPCIGCKTMIAAGCADLCSDCYWRKNLWKKFSQNIQLFENDFLKKQYENYIHWLTDQVGAHKAAVYIHKHTDFFIKTEILWNDSMPDIDQLLLILRTSGLRKFEMVMKWFDQVHDIKTSSLVKKECSENDQIDNLIKQLPSPSLAFDVVSAYKDKLNMKLSSGTTSIRSIRLAIKPAVSLMLSIGEDGNVLPNLNFVKVYLTNFVGQTAALTGFINFLNDQYATNIDYISFKKSKYISNVAKVKLENELLEILGSGNEVNHIVWVRKGLQYFHNMSYQNTFKIKEDMISEIEDGFNIIFNEKCFWLPKQSDLLNGLKNKGIIKKAY